jgi:hypothetical protein
MLVCPVSIMWMEANSIWEFVWCQGVALIWLIMGMLLRGFNQLGPDFYLWIINQSINQSIYLLSIYLPTYLPTYIMKQPHQELRVLLLAHLCVTLEIGGDTRMVGCNRSALSLNQLLSSGS